MKQYLNNISTVDIGRYIGLGQGKKELTDELRMKILTDYHFWFPDDSFDIPNKVSIIDGRTEKKKKVSETGTFIQVSLPCIFKDRRLKVKSTW